MSTLPKYRKLATVPPNLVLCTGGSFTGADAPELVALRQRTDLLKWSGPTLVIPAIGDCVHVRMNRMGKGTVIGYFSEHGWFGVLVVLHEPPAWFCRQNGARTPAHVFGNELGSVWITLPRAVEVFS